MATPSAARQASLREHNLALALGIVADAPEPPSRAEVAQRAGLTRSTAAHLIDRLVDARLVEELPPTFSGRAGRPATPLRLAHGTFAGLGLEVGVDYRGVRAMDLAGRILSETIVKEDHQADDAGTVLGRLARQAKGLGDRVGSGETKIVGATLALPGLVARPLGPLRLAPNLGWADVDVATPLKDLGAPLLGVENEAHLAARAELHALRGAEGARSFCYVSGGIGVGAAIVIEGRILGGQHGWAGEIGHVVVDPAGPPCRCGSNGCLEQYSGKAALGDVKSAAWALGIVLSDFVNLFDIPGVVLGGDFAPLAAALAPGIESEMARRVLAGPWLGRQLRVRPARAAGLPALTGAALTCLDGVLANPAAQMPS